MSSTPRSLSFECALVTGGAGGIGKAISKYLIDQGKKVIICGRTANTLAETAREIGAAAWYKLDTGDTPSIPEFIKTITQEHPELDCLINNAGVQRPLSFTEMSPEEFLEKADNEISINIQGPMHLAVGLLPHLKSKKSAVIMNVSSVLGFIPFMIINPVYNGTKAWLHAHTMNMRTQLTKAGCNIKVIEIVPPGVGTDLHREREDPDDNKKHKNPSALTVEEFMDELVQGWKEDKDCISAGMGNAIVDRWYKEFGPDYAKAESK